MALWHKKSNPIDRCVADLDDQIAELDRKLRRLESDAESPLPTGNATVATPAASAMTDFVKTMLKPATQAAPAPYRPPRYDLFDDSVQPLKELEADAAAFAHTPASESLPLGQPVETPAAIPGKKPRPESDANNKLIHYLAPESIKSYRPPLKHVQREQRNRFYMWIGLSCLALWILYVIVR